MPTSWWLDYSALPERLLWARLEVTKDGLATVLDLDGRLYHFPSGQEAKDWLSEDEYSTLGGLIEDGEVDPATEPPSAATDAQLVPLMSSEGSTA